MFSGLPPVRVFRRFDFAGLVPVKIKTTLNYRVQVHRSKNLKVQSPFGFKNSKPSIRLML